MKLASPVTLAALLAASASGENICPFADKTNTGYSICGRNGDVWWPNQINKFTSGSKDRADCVFACQFNSKCHSFAYNTATNTCRLFGRSLYSQLWWPNRRSTSKYWQKDCFTRPATCGTSTGGSGGTGGGPSGGGTGSGGTGSTGGKSTGGDGIYTPSTFTYVEATSSDSPSYTGGSVAFPTGDLQFTATYSYEDDPFPTVTILGDPTVAGLAGPTDLPTRCVIDPATSAQVFHVIGKTDGPLVSRSAAGPGPVQSPTFQAQADSLFGDPANFVYPDYSFVAPAGAAAGVYDLVMAGSPPRYIARTSTGNVVFTDSSTGPNYVLRGGQRLVTSIFGVTCQGKITVKQGATTYSWQVTGDRTTMPAGDGSISFYTLTAAAANKSALKRRNMYTEGRVPRCPNTPPNLQALVKPNARGLNPNGCGSATTDLLVPDFTFGRCCDAHDNCFDNCHDKTFEQCNGEFRSCMRGSGCAYANHWYSYPLYLACLGWADFYAAVVDGSAGVSAFREANDERCKCYCPGGLDMCHSNGADQCINLRGNDVNNCGGCGRTCPQGSICSNGNCVCPHDQCGTRCVNLGTHPRNCGSCGHTCSTGYCVGGQCYAPPAGTCAAGEGFRNGNFPYVQGQGFDFTSWTSNGDAGTSVAAVFDGAADDSTGIAMDFPGQSQLTISTDVKVCAGTDYTLTFQGRQVYAGQGTCQLRVTIGSRTIQDWRSIPVTGTSWTSFGAYNMGAFTSGDGAFMNGAEQRATFSLTTSCNGQTSIRYDSFSLVPQ